MAERHYRINVVAEMVGISESLLRAWERRYGVVKPRRSPGGFRVYSDSDVELLKRINQLVKEGMSIGDVAPMLPDLQKEVAARHTSPAPTAAAAKSRVEEWMRRALVAAELSDQPAVEAVLDEALTVLPPLVAAEELLMPLQREVGDRWHAGSFDVAQEHAVSHAVRVRMLRLIHATSTGWGRHVVCACFPEELHDLGLLYAALRFRNAGLRVTYLGARTPVNDVVSMATRVKADLVALSASQALPRDHVVSTLAQLRKGLPASTRLVVGGAGAEALADDVTKTGAELITADTWHLVL
ncbi:MAG: MerR family transcriptional regulator [Myxococcota bacterium]